MILKQNCVLQDTPAGDIPSTVIILSQLLMKVILLLITPLIRVIVTETTNRIGMRIEGDIENATEDHEDDLRATIMTQAATVATTPIITIAPDITDREDLEHL